MRPQHRQQDARHDGLRGGAFHLRGLDQRMRHAAQAGPERDRDQRRMVQRHHQDDAAAADQGIRRAGRGREPDQREHRRVRREQAEKGERRHLRRDHHREDQPEGERALAAQVGNGEQQRKPAADQQGAERRETGGFETVKRCIDRRAAGHDVERRARREHAAGREGGQGETQEGQGAEQNRDERDRDR